MKHSGQCPKCESTRLIANAKAVDRGESNLEWELSLATFAAPDAMLFKGKKSTTVSAWVCGDCGYVELYANQPQELHQQDS
jgi:predicted nucleic-acid-binding Zn-ribbon protein